MVVALCLILSFASVLVMFAAMVAPFLGVNPIICCVITYFACNLALSLFKIALQTIEIEENQACKK